MRFDTTPADVARDRRRRAAILALLFSATLINYIDRQVLAVLKAPMSDEFGWSDADYANLLIWFNVAYAIGQAASGVLLDKLGLKAGFALFVAAWSFAAAGHALAATLAGFAFARFLLGLSEAANWPAAAKATGEWFAPRDRAFATGVWNTGSATGAIVAAPLVTWIALRFADAPPTGAEGIAPRPHWQMAFVVTASLGALWIVAWLATYRPRAAEPAASATSPGAPTAADAPASVTRLELLRRPEVIGLFIARFTTDPVWWFFVGWLPGYLSKQRGLDLASMGKIAWIPFLFADLGSLLGGATSSWMIRRGVSVVVARKRVMAVSAFLTPIAMYTGSAESVFGVIACSSIATFAHQFFASSMLTLPADLFRGPVVATCSGLTGVGATTGNILALIGIGGFVEQIGYGPLFVIAGLGHPLAVAATYLLVRPRASATPTRGAA